MSSNNNSDPPIAWDSWSVRNRIVFASCLLIIAAAAHGVDESVPASDRPQPTATSEKAPTFDILELQVEGNTLLDRVLIERTVYPFVGHDKTIDAVEAARLALETFYRDAGYATVVVDIPEQEVAQGIVRLKVVEGKVERVRVAGSRYFSLGRITAGVPALAPGQVPNVPALQAQLAELNQTTPDRTVTPIFRPGRTPGTVEVELRVKDELPLHGDLEVNDRYSRDTTRTRAAATLRYANLWQRQHSASLMYQTAPENADEVQVLAGTYVWPLGTGKVLAAYVVDSSSNVATAGDLSVVGNGSIVGTRFIRALTAGGNYFHSATFGLDYKNFEEDVVLIDGPGFNTPIDYVNLLAQYRGTLLRPGAKLSAGVSANLGVRGLGNSEEEFGDKRYKARPNYLYVGAFAEYLRELPYGLQMQSNFDAQLAESPLVSNEQFGIGGVDSVRGYYESQAMGDNGLVARFELRSPSYAERVPKLRELRFLTFADAGKLIVREPLPGQVDGYELYSAGVGMRVEADKGFDASFDWAWPLRDATDVEKGDPRGHFRLHYGF